ncbi:Parvovirus non-structural protein NS1 [Popillia japonica]|uniref:Parvovirus non-structural protein NS1 n=1 Tax=Popillia japonica TaxID=7064 RepID=A0AAW1JBK6_POPJA
MGRAARLPLIQWFYRIGKRAARPMLWSQKCLKNCRSLLHLQVTATFTQKHWYGVQKLSYSLSPTRLHPSTVRKSSIKHRAEYSFSSSVPEPITISSSVPEPITMSTPGEDVTTDYPIDKEVTTIYTDSLAKWTQLVDLLASTYPDIHQIMRARNTNTNKAFSDTGLYLKVIDSTENVSWETYKQYLEQNISYTPYLATEDILTVMTGVNKLKTSTNQAEDLNHSSPLRPTTKRSADETTYTSFMPVPSPTGAAGVASLENILEGQSSAYDGVTSHSPTSEISCSTSIHGHESTTTFTYPEQQGKYYVQMKVFKFADVLSVSPEKLWTKALQDMKFVISDRAEDEITKHTMNLVSAVHRHSRDHPKTAQSVKRKRNDSFPLNDCTDKRILVWDEPNYTRENLETIKMLFSGDNTPANVKYENQVVIEKTPLLITTNTDVFPTSDDFNKRMVRYRWTQLPSTDEDHDTGGRNFLALTKTTSNSIPWRYQNYSLFMIYIKYTYHAYKYIPTN